MEERIGSVTAIVVHGHRDRSRGAAISAECVARLSVAEQAAAELGVGDVLLSGGGMSGAPSEAEQMADLWSGPAIRLWLDGGSADSEEAVDSSLRWARDHRARYLVVVSSWWHLRLRLYYGGAGAFGIRVRHLSSWRMNGLRRHLLHELRYLPRALRHGPCRGMGSTAETREEDQPVAMRLRRIQAAADRQVLRGAPALRPPRAT